MKRISVTPRHGWRDIIEQQGFKYNCLDGSYWAEEAGYRFTKAEARELEDATNELHRMCLYAVDYVVSHGLYDLFGIPERFHALITRSWEQQHPSVYGRFDLRYDGESPPKMYEYNGDTPVLLLESARIQSGWQSELFKAGSQFNRIEERLIETWRMVARRHPRVHFSSLAGFAEANGNVDYMRAIARQAGIDDRFLFVEEVAWDSTRDVFVDQYGELVSAWFKLYPWEWIFEDAYADKLVDSRISVMEPAWKVLMSSKAILPILWQLFPDHPNLLPAYFSPEKLGKRYARKPMYGREGANVRLVDGLNVAESPGPYGAHGYVYQELFPLPIFGSTTFGNIHALVGSWVIGEHAAGIGIRESADVITPNIARFVPHVVQ